MSPLQAEIENLREENEHLTVSANDCTRLRTAVAELEARLEEMQQRLQEQTSLVGFVFSLITVRNMCLCGLVVTAQLNIHRSCDTISDVGIVENLWKILFISCKINSSEEEALFSATSNKLGQCVSMCVSAHEHISGAAGPNCTKFVVQIPCDRGSVLL